MYIGFVLLPHFMQECIRNWVGVGVTIKPLAMASIVQVVSDVSLKAVSTYSEKLSTLLDVNVFVEVCYPTLLHAAYKTCSKYNAPHWFRSVFYIADTHSYSPYMYLSFLVRFFSILYSVRDRSQRVADRTQKAQLQVHVCMWTRDCIMPCMHVFLFGTHP